MPKLKTHKGMKKRIKVTKKGKLKRRRAFRNHMMEKKQNSRKRQYTKEFNVSSNDRKNVKRMLGK